jgi:hypothetical protein
MKTSLVIPLLLGVFSNVPIAMAQSAGAFSPTGNLTTPREEHTATLLPNGKVLIAGGDATSDGTRVLVSAELYDPSTGTFTATGDMTTPRAAHSATLLPNGKVLISGGFSIPGNSRDMASAELYDPSTGTFRATGAMTQARVRPTATLLNNGQVLIAGGFDGSSLASAELYDPSPGTFTSTADMTGTGASTATLLPNGKVLILRAADADDIVPNHAELYDPATGQFTRTADKTYEVFDPAAVLLTNGKVLIAGGWVDRNDYFPVPVAELYDPAIGAFTATVNMTDELENGAATLLPDGNVFIEGAARYHAGATAFGAKGTTQLYDPVTGSFTSPGDTPPTSGYAVTLLPDGTILISGGFDPSLVGGCCGSIATAEIYHPAVLVPAPVLFSLPGDGQGQGAIWDAATGLVASSNNPAVAGEVLAMYATSLADGGVIPPQVAIAGKLAELLYFGNAPGYPGYSQVNFRVPSGVSPGPAVPVRLTYLSRPSNEVTIGVQ